MKSLCNRRVSGCNPDTLKEIVRFVHEVHPVFVVTLSTFLHMICGWNDDVALNGAFWTNTKSGDQRKFKKWNPFVRDEFPDEILILWKRLSVLYTKCNQPSQLSCTCYVDEMMISCQLSTFSELIWNAFQF